MSPAMKASASGLGVQRPMGAARSRVVLVRAGDNLAQRPELKKPAEPTATSPEPTAPVPAAPSDESSVAGSVLPTIEYQRTRAKAMRSYFQQIKLNEQVVKAQVFGWTRANEITNGRWVMFGLLVGMMTEFATGYSFPDQIALLLSYLGITDVE